MRGSDIHHEALREKSLEKMERLKENKQRKKGWEQMEMKKENLLCGKSFPESNRH